MIETIKRHLRRYLARQEHYDRLDDIMWDVHFNQSVEYIKERNKERLFNELAEASGIDTNDIISSIQLDRLIERKREEGLISELYIRKY